MQIKVLNSSSKDNHAQALYRLCLDIESFVTRANNAAASLYAITQLCTSMFGGARDQRDIAKKLMAVAGALSSLREMLDDALLMTAAHVELLAEQMEKCTPFLAKVEETVQTLHDLGPVDARLPGYFNTFMKGEEIEPQKVLDACFHAILKVRLTAGSRGEESSVHRPSMFVCQLTPLHTEPRVRIRHASAS
jgi:hypothetical protein